MYDTLCTMYLIIFLKTYLLILLYYKIMCNNIKQDLNNVYMLNNYIYLNKVNYLCKKIIFS
jgi:hypothetical protein